MKQAKLDPKFVQMILEAREDGLKHANNGVDVFKSLARLKIDVKNSRSI